MQKDWGVVNHWVCTHPDSNQVRNLLIVAFQRQVGKDGRIEICGKRMLVNNTIKENLGGRTVILKQCHREDERIREIQDRFGITLTEEEQVAMVGRSLSLA